MTTEQTRRGPQPGRAFTPYQPLHMIVLQPGDRFATLASDGRATVWIIDHDGAPTAKALPTDRDEGPWTR